jgi:hypothetical protein
LAVVSTIYSTGSAAMLGRRARYPQRSFARFQALMSILNCRIPPHIGKIE